MICSLTTNQRLEKINIKQKLLSIFIVISIIIEIFTGIYLTYTPVKGEVIEGIQGRYFLPLLIILPVIFSNNKIIFSKINNYKYKYLILSIFILLSHLISYYSIIRRYYIPT